MTTNNIPIFRGTKNVSKFFDERGIIFWETVEDLEKVLDNLNEELYQTMLPYVKINYELAKRYLDADEVLCRMINNCIANADFNTMKEFEYERKATN